ncbi:conserved hypothetical protein [Arthrobacter sp. Hiyo8]|nr:conserved hypothetical protein [Arthrobacter sp. Hiyo8]
MVAGILYIVTFVSSIPALFLISPVLNDPHYITGPGADSTVIFGCFLDLVNAVSAVGTAVALFPVVKRQNEGIALGFVTARMFEAAVIVIGVVSLLAVVTLRQNSGADPALVPVGQALVAVRGWTFILGPSLVPGVSGLLLGYLMYRSGLVPRIIPLLGLIGGPLLLSSTLSTMFGINQGISVWSDSQPCRSSFGSCRWASGWRSRASGPRPSPQGRCAQPEGYAGFGRARTCIRSPCCPNKLMNSTGFPSALANQCGVRVSNSAASPARSSKSLSPSTRRSRPLRM